MIPIHGVPHDFYDKMHIISTESINIFEIESFAIKIIAERDFIVKSKPHNITQFMKQKSKYSI